MGGETATPPFACSYCSTITQMSMAMRFLFGIVVWVGDLAGLENTLRNMNTKDLCEVDKGERSYQAL